MFFFYFIFIFKKTEAQGHFSFQTKWIETKKKREKTSLNHPSSNCLTFIRNGFICTCIECLCEINGNYAIKHSCPLGNLCVYVCVCCIIYLWMMIINEAMKMLGNEVLLIENISPFAIQKKKQNKKKIDSTSHYS